MKKSTLGIPAGSDCKAVFQNTLWSRVFAAGAADPQRASQALEELCQLYWYPIYAFLRRCGHDRQRASDLTQGFFAYLLEGSLVKRADPQRGRFRSFLLGTVKHFVAHELEKERAIRRGGGQAMISLDEQAAEGRYKQEPSTALTPEKLFDRRWAMTVLEEAMNRIQAEYARAGMKDILEAVQPYLTGDGEAGFAELGNRLGKSEGATRVLVHRLRNRFRQLILAVIGDTVSDLDQVDDEIKHLQQALRGT